MYTDEIFSQRRRIKKKKEWWQKVPSNLVGTQLQNSEKTSKLDPGKLALSSASSSCPLYLLLFQMYIVA